MWKPSKFGVLLAAVLAGSVWFYVHRVLIPYQQADAAANGQPRGSLSDLYPRWLGARELLLRHRDPYSYEITREIQAGYYGRPIDASRPDDPKDEVGFAYPVYVVFLLAPAISFPFRTAQIATGWTLEILTAASIFLWLQLLRWRPPLSTLLILALMTMSSYSAVQGIMLQQLSLLVCFLIAASLVLLARGRLVAAGAFLALATIKPQLVVLLVPWLVFWSVSRWRERQRFFWSFAGACAVLVIAGELVLPGWIGRFLRAMIDYQRYTSGISPLGVLTGPGLGELLAALVLLGTAALCWRRGTAAAGSADFIFTLAAVLTVTLAVVPILAPYNQLLLLPAVFLVVQSWPRLWRKGWPTRFACGLVAFSVLWPWLASAGLVVASFFLPPATVQRAWSVPLWTLPATSLALLVPLILLARDPMEPQAA